MTDEELITEFGALVIGIIEERGVVASRLEGVAPMTGTNFRIDNIRLGRSDFDLDTRSRIAAFVDQERVFYDEIGGPHRDDYDYDYDAIRKLMPRLIQLTLLDRLASTID